MPVNCSTLVIQQSSGSMPVSCSTVVIQQSSGSMPVNCSTLVVQQSSDSMPVSCSTLVIQQSSDSMPEVVLRSTGTLRIPSTTTSLRVENCTTVRVEKEALKGLSSLRQLELAHIPVLVLESYSFQWNESTILEGVPPRGIEVRITNCSMSAVPSYTFKGRIESIVLTSVRILTVETFALASLHGTERVHLTGCEVETFQAQAFKKFSVQSLLLEGGRLGGTLPSRTIVDLEVHREVLIRGVTFPKLRSSALMLHSPLSFRMQDCRVGHMEGEALKVVARGPVILQNNEFESLDAGAFLGLSSPLGFVARHGRQEFIFENNTVHNFVNRSLIVDGECFAPRFYRVYVKHTCSCEGLDTWDFQLTVKPSDGRRTDVMGGFWCRQESRPGLETRFIRFQEYSGYHCGYTTRNLYVFIGVIVASLIGLLALAMLIIFLWRRRASHKDKEWINIPTGDDVNKGGVAPRIKMVVPDGRTYKETELHVIVERAEPIKDQNYSPEGDSHILQPLPYQVPPDIAQIWKAGLIDSGTFCQLLWH
uniref:Right handed beta helix domain-containing protein n=1 Tax=Timema bartmani TaxID=61472 RepID=A0A7R9F2C5_9NEOP|nr:unnamed protein product [Timema bartmani]